MKVIKQFTYFAAVLLSSFLFLSCKNGIVMPPGYDSIPIDTIQSWEQVKPSNVTFYVETSGSMNGFFRGNKDTHFKDDVWSILGHFKSITKGIKVFTDAKGTLKEYSAEDFRKGMNSGSFVSSIETIVPNMYQTVLNDFNPESGECAVLISDMIYSPVRNKDIAVLLKQYETDIRDIAKQKLVPTCVLCAVSNYIDRKNTVDRSPYYYLILGNKENVAYMRNYIAATLKLEPEKRGEQSRYVEAIDFGIHYGNPKYKFISTNGVTQYNSELAFLGYERSIDSCSIGLSLDLSKYPWILTNDLKLDSLIDVETEFGTIVSIEDVQVNERVDLHESVPRIAEANINFSLSRMSLSADILSWRLSVIPLIHNDEFSNILSGQSENERDKTFTMNEFLRGMSGAYSKEENDYIKLLVSTSKL